MTAPKPKGHFRRVERRKTDLSATLELGATQTRVRLSDLGLGGAAVSCELCPAVGAGATLAIEAQSLWDPLRLRGEVAWATSTCFGLRFVDVGDEAAGALLDLLAADEFE